MRQFITSARNFMADDSGATMVEYALMVALIAVACIAAVTAVGTALTTKFNAVATAI